ncbi:hypothetical protein LCGC14_0143040 [marine sediment metagenome]|uniref:Uncharacterized protein n=1 Tax=marine sediment metagenome TaxID=412755 RepID=A0A0F9Y2W9_9ZZZZ
MKVRAKCNLSSLGIKGGKVYKVELDPRGNAYSVNGRLIHKDWFVVVPPLWKRILNRICCKNT